MNIEDRRGARKLADVPEEVRELLNQGKISSVNLMESLAINHSELVKNVLKEADAENYINSSLQELDNLEKKTSLKCIIAIGRRLQEEISKNNDKKLLEFISNHNSDTVRSWGAYIIGLDDELSIGEKLIAIEPFAADKHFGVREIAWMAVRESIIDNLDESIDILSSWSTNEDSNIRRFASEATRPRGVWSKHIKKLKEEPELGLKIIEPLKSDSEKYVQDSVGNWLNDASKSNPNWVVNICNEWNKVSPTKETKRITNRGLRTI
ncbi:DNA alkylation repair enzyme [Methanobrevibacter cuticularis]|uniref:DNA alkylation repair enzyme n=1 Tax=Methanobrevibacter cuticularis TaxID=47311 RepID=A0A166D1P3_9EURY|nr:DNA alkylation repair protein [Methanobrevibacter cuticularis]KZX15112.1 DNA alkylation repair enzyme [Methanobrevibacter cuticularis]